MKKFIIITLSIILLVALGTGGWALYLYHSASKAADKMHYSIKRVNTNQKTTARIEKKDPLTFLLLGIDSKESEKGRSDVMMAVTVNPNSNTVKIVSIPRDTRTDIIGRGTKDKINHSYAFGGPEMAIATVENFLDIPVDHFVSINMYGFRDMVTAVGGVTVNNNLDFEQNNFTFHKGMVTLDGDQALAFVRHRKTDPRGDLGRNERQKEVIQAVIEKTLQNPNKIKEILNVLGKNVKTDLTFDEMKSLFTDYIGAKDNIKNILISGSGTKINGIYYYQVEEQERLRVSQELKDNLKKLSEK